MKSFASLPQLMVFAKIAETNNLSKAAKELNITPSAVSKSLALLEQRMGILLVKRTTRSVQLTEQGKAFFERVSTILTDVEAALDETNSFKSHPEGTLRLTCSIAFGCTRLMRFVGRYMEEYPNVNVHVTLDDRHANLNEEKFDIALRITETTNWAYSARKLAPIHWVYCASPTYLGNHGIPETPEDLLTQPGYRCLVYPAMTSHGAWTYWHDGNLQEVKVHGALECNSSLALLAAALDHKGIACLPTYVASCHILNGGLKILFPSFRSASGHMLYAMYFQNRYKNPIIRSFIDFLVAEISPVPPWDATLQDKLDIGP